MFKPGDYVKIKPVITPSEGHHGDVQHASLNRYETGFIKQEVPEKPNVYYVEIEFEADDDDDEIREVSGDDMEHISPCTTYSP